MRKEDIENIVQRVLDEEQVELVELQVKGSPGRELVRVYVHAEDGITINRCAQLSRRIADLFDRKDVFSGNYRLEVSSPGTDRPLKTEKDFLRNVGREVTCDVKSDEGVHKVSGTVQRVHEGSVELQVGDSIETIALDMLINAQIKLKW